MELDFFLENTFWSPVLLWVALHFWFRNVSYAVFMKKQVNRGQKWAYVSEGYVKHPGRVSFLRLCDIVFTFVVSLVSSVVVVWLLKNNGLEGYEVYGYVSILIFFLLAYLMKRRTDSRLTDLFQSAFYLEYRRVRYEIGCKGILMDENNVRNRAGLSYAHKLRKAEDHHRFWKYVKAMAKSKKVPPEIFEVY